METTSCGRFHKHFTHLNYSPGKISCTVQCMHAPKQGFQNALAYFATAVIDVLEMFMKSTPGVSVKAFLSSALMLRQNKLECLSTSNFKNVLKKI
jgi:hypothetical protein